MAARFAQQLLHYMYICLRFHLAKQGQVALFQLVLNPIYDYFFAFNGTQGKNGPQHGHHRLIMREPNSKKISLGDNDV